MSIRSDAWLTYLQLGKALVQEVSVSLVLLLKQAATVLREIE